MRKIRILRIIARLNIGGPAIHTILLTEGLDNKQFESLLVCGSTDKYEGDMFYYAREKGLNPIYIPELKRELNFFNDIIAFKKIYKIIKNENPNLIHTHTAKAGTLGRLAGILYNLFTHPNKRVKLIHTFHGHVFSGYFNILQTKIFILVERFLGSFSYKIITVSESVKKELLSLHICKEDKIEVIPLGFELNKFLVIPSRNSAVLSVGIIGRLVPIKNHRLFLEAAAKVFADLPALRLEFKIIGDGKLRKELEEYARRLNMVSTVNFLGWQQDLVSVYSGLDIVALTSLNEGTPVSLIEAMASGRAVVTTDVGGVRDLLGKEINVANKLKGDFKVMERGIMVKSRNYFNFANALIFLLQNKKLREDIGLEAKNFVKDNFRKERLIKDIENLYKNIMICT